MHIIPRMPRIISTMNQVISFARKRLKQRSIDAAIRMSRMLEAYKRRRSVAPSCRAVKGLKSSKRTPGRQDRAVGHSLFFAAGRGGSSLRPPGWVRTPFLIVAIVTSSSE
jgi:hypothetical protein